MNVFYYWIYDEGTTGIRGKKGMNYNDLFGIN